MWIVYTEDGLRNIRLVDLKFHTRVKNWICRPANNLYNFNNSKPIGFISDTICRGLSHFEFNAEYKSPQGKEIIFDKPSGICKKENCYCGMDIGLPKGITDGHIDELIRLVTEMPMAELKKVPYYNNEKILAFGFSSFILEQMVHVDWFLGRRCNFDCSYCPPTIHDKVSPYPSMEKLTADYTFLTDLIVKRESNIDKKIVNYIFAGGEPTLIPDYLAFLNMIKSDTRFKSEILTLTNLSVNHERLYEINKLSKITFSVHMEYMTDKFLDKVERFLEVRDETSKRLNVKFMYHRDHRDKILKIIDIVSKYTNLDYEVMALHNKGNEKILYDYNDNDKQFFKLRGSIK